MGVPAFSPTSSIQHPSTTHSSRRVHQSSWTSSLSQPSPWHSSL
jgi:hypothetical protein